MFQFIFNPLKSPLHFSNMNQYFLGSFHGNFIFSQISISLAWHSITYFLLQIFDINKPVLFLGTSQEYRVIKPLSYLWNSPYLLLEKKINFFSFEKSMWAVFLKRKMPIFLCLWFFNISHKLKLNSLFLFYKKYKVFRILLPYFDTAQLKVKPQSYFHFRYSLKFSPIYNYKFLNNTSRQKLSSLKKVFYFYFLYKYRFIFDQLTYKNFFLLLSQRQLYNKSSNQNSYQYFFLKNLANIFYTFTSLDTYNPAIFIFNSDLKPFLLKFFFFRHFLFINFSLVDFNSSYNFPFYYYSNTSIKKLFNLFLKLRSILLHQCTNIKFNLFLNINFQRLGLIHKYGINCVDPLGKNSKNAVVKVKSKLLKVNNFWYFSNNIFWKKYFVLNNSKLLRFKSLDNVSNLFLYPIFDYNWNYMLRNQKYQPLKLNFLFLPYFQTTSMPSMLGIIGKKLTLQPAPFFWYRKRSVGTLFFLIKKQVQLCFSFSELFKMFSYTFFQFLLKTFNYNSNLQATTITNKSNLSLVQNVSYKKRRCLHKVIQRLLVQKKYLYNCGGFITNSLLKKKKNLISKGVYNLLLKKKLRLKIKLIHLKLVNIFFKALAYKAQRPLARGLRNRKGTSSRSLINKSFKSHDSLLSSGYESRRKKLLMYTKALTKMNMTLFSPVLNNWIYYYFSSGIKTKFYDNTLVNIYSVDLKVVNTTTTSKAIFNKQVIYNQDFLWNKAFKDPKSLLLYGFSFNLNESRDILWDPSMYRRNKWTQKYGPVRTVRFLNSLYYFNLYFHLFFRCAFTWNHFSHIFFCMAFLKWIKKPILHKHTRYKLLHGTPFFERYRWTWKSSLNISTFSMFKGYALSRMTVNKLYQLFNKV